MSTARAAGIAAATFLACASQLQAAELAAGEFNSTVKAAGIQNPGGMAIHPVTKELYITEGGRVSVVRDGKAVPVITTGWRMMRDLAPWLMTDERPLESWLRPALNNPHAIAISPDGHIFVAENVPDGRILEFIPDAAGKFTTARVIAVPWLQYDFTWKSLAFSSDGYLTVAGISESRAGEPPYGSVVTRDAENNWWAVDYGVFARFTSLGLSRDQDILVVGDEYSDHVVWWDTTRRLAIGSATGKTDNIKSVGVMPDGSILAVEETAAEAVADRKAHLVRIDPQTYESRIVASGLGAVDGITISPDSGTVYVSQPSEGRILELQPKFPILTNNYLLQRSLMAYEAKGGLAPRNWPSYLQNFVRKLGVDPVSEREAKPKRVTASTDKPKEEKPTLTPEAFGTKIPFIAGMVKSDPNAEVTSADPVEQVDFIVFFPSSSLKREDFSTPSLSLFSARHQSGKVLRSMKLPGMSRMQKNADGTWSQAASKTTLFVPIATCSATPVADGVDISICFLGLDLMEDYYMQFHLGEDANGRLIVNGNQQAMIKYNMSLTETDEETGTEVPTVVMAGFNRKKAEKYSWLKLGIEPQEQFLQTEDQPPWTSRWMSEQAPEINAMIKEQSEAIRSAMRKQAEPDTKGATANKPAVEKLSPIPAPPSPSRSAQAQPSQPSIDQQAALDEEEDEAEDAWTNMILSRAMQVWMGEN